MNKVQSSGKPDAVILGGGFISLGAARALASQGVPVTILSHELAPANFSRSVSRNLQSPRLVDEEMFVDFLEKAASAQHLQGSVLFPSTDEGVKLLSRHRQRLDPHYILTVPEWEITRLLFDKRLTHHLAQQRGVPIPATANPASFEELAGIDIEFPVVLKPVLNSRLISATNKKAFLANNREELIELYAMMVRIVDPREILVQELIPGGAARLYSYFGYFKEGRLVTGYSAKRSRQSPMDFGLNSTFVETVDLPELEQLAIQLIFETGFTGLAEIEFMDNEKHRRFELIEVNTRLWGWHSLAVSAGVNLPYLAYADAVDEPIELRHFRAHVKWIHLISDLPVAVSEMGQGRLSLGDYLRSLRHSRDAVISWRDPLPMVVEFLEVCTKRINKWLYPRRVR